MRSFLIISLTFLTFCNYLDARPLTSKANTSSIPAPKAPVPLPSKEDDNPLATVLTELAANKSTIKTSSSAPIALNLTTNVTAPVSISANNTISTTTTSSRANTISTSKINLSSLIMATMNGTSNNAKSFSTTMVSPTSTGGGSTSTTTAPFFYGFSKVILTFMISFAIGLVLILIGFYLNRMKLLKIRNRDHQYKRNDG